MSSFMHDVARASLPVAVALLIFTAAARGALWAQIDDVRAQRIARRYLEPLSTWCLVAVATYLFALSAAGDGGLLPFVLPVGLGVAAVLLRPPGETDEPSAVETEAPPTASAPAAARPAPGRLWSH